MIELTAEVVSAYLANNSLPTAEIPDFIRSIYAALVATSSLQQGAESVRAQPAVPVKKSVTPEAIYCLECGKPQKMLKRHLATAHSLTPDEYRTKWGLASSYPLVAPEYAAQRSALAKKIGLGQSRGRAVAAAAPVVAEKPKRGPTKVAAAAAAPGAAEKPKRGRPRKAAAE